MLHHSWVLSCVSVCPFFPPLLRPALPRPWTSCCFSLCNKSAETEQTRFSLSPSQPPSISAVCLDLPVWKDWSYQMKVLEPQRPIRSLNVSHPNSEIGYEVRFMAVKAGNFTESFKSLSNLSNYRDKWSSLNCNFSTFHIQSRVSKLIFISSNMMHFTSSSRTT